MANNSKIYFYLGKGGVGKSTLSAAEALRFSRRFKTLLVSLDPAHNQSDIFEGDFGEKPVSVRENLYVMEIDGDLWIKRYIDTVQNKIKDNYRYLSAVNLDKKFDVLKYSPGLEEYALMLAFETIIAKYDAFDLLIFDMPPTALSLRFFALPKLSLVWIESLLSLRKEIIEKRQIITKIKFGKKTVERDKVLNRLEEISKQYRHIGEIFGNKEDVKINIVLNNDRLSLKESQRIFNGLKKLDIQIASLLLNRVKEDNSPRWDLSALFNNLSVSLYPEVKFSLIGLKALEKFVALTQAKS